MTGHSADTPNRKWQRFGSVDVRHTELKRVWPALPPMQYPEHLHAFASNTVRHQIGRSADNQFPRSFATPSPSRLWKVRKPRDCSYDGLYLVICC